MTRPEKRWLFVGVLGGAIVAGGIGFGLFYRFKERQTTPTTTEPAPVTQPVPRSTPTVSSGNIQSAIQLSSDEQAKIGLQTTEVRRESVTEDISAIGRVEGPETALATVSTRFGGRVEHLFINFTGQPVKKGDPVATIQITEQPATKA